MTTATLTPEQTDLAARAIQVYAQDPEYFFTHALQVAHLWEGERLILQALPRALAEHKAIYIASGHACCAKGTLCRMADGSTRAIERVQLGESVMGDDSTPRRVLRCVAGRDRLYRVRYRDGTEYVHNGAHQLVLRQMSTCGRMRRDQVVTASVEDWLEWGSKYQRRHCGFRHSIIYPERTLPIPPYVFGLWLGDGCESTADFAVTEPLLKQELATYARSLGCTLSEQRNHRNLYLRYHGAGHGRNPFVQCLHELGVYRHKHIPPDYLTSSAFQREELLAGLLDSDGSKNSNGGYEITQRRRELAEQIVVLARSLGFPASITSRSVSARFPGGYEKTGIYHRVYIGTTQVRLPLRLSRKSTTTRTSTADPASTAIRSITPIGMESYYGFTLDGNHRFLGADNLVLHNCGKDFISGGLPLWWQTTRYPAKTILTGPTGRQVHEITWNELVKHIARWHPALPPLGGRLLHGQYEWDAEHFILAFTTAHSHQHVGKAQGFHSPHMLVIVTEAQAVPASVKEQLDGLLTSSQALLIVIGNPLQTTGWFAEGLRDPQAHVVIHLDCEDSPNVREGREVIPGLVSKAWVEDKRARWYAENPNHPLWLARVKGQLPTTSVNSVFDRDLLDRSQTFALADRGDRVVLGLDPAEFGDDESAFCVIADGLTRVMLTTAKHEPTDTAGRANSMRVREQARLIVVDRLGVGAGVTSMLQEMREPGWSLLPLNVAEKPLDPASPYLNQRSELYFHARLLLQEGKLRAPADSQTVEELCETRYFFNSKGKIQLERKEDIKDRLGRSPDRADAWVLAAWGLQFVQPLSEGGGEMPTRIRQLLDRRRMAARETVNF